MFPDLVYGIVAPIGVEIEDVISNLEASLRRFGFRVNRIKVTDTFRTFTPKFKPWINLDSTPYASRLNSHIAYGNQLRENFDNNAILAEASIFQINNIRNLEYKAVNENIQTIPEGLAFIVHQFKRNEEVELYRETYAEKFSQISVYSRRENRIDVLSRKFASDASVSSFDDYREIAENFVKRDFDERKKPYGQRISKIFHNADLIVNNDIREPSPRKQIERFIDLQFGSNSYSPSKAEYGMFSANGAALRSLDLSRQVGAAIFSSKGEIVTLGSNEVPKAGGGTYWGDEDHDDREYLHKNDANDVRKREIIKEMFDLSVKNGFINNITFDEFISSEGISDSRFMDALEYGRIIHAEMNAITDAARLGRSVGGSTLFCTTFPCHMCAKHIISSGLKKVIFLEPYPKSLAKDLHSDAISVEGADRAKYRHFPEVQFEHFFGITPRQYKSLFSRSKRKDNNGRYVPFRKLEKNVSFGEAIPFHIIKEILLLRASVKAFLKTKPQRNSKFS